VNATSSLERNYSRSASIVAGVGVFATGFGQSSVADATVDSQADSSPARSDTTSFTAALVAASAA
jgi:hypothetical protein